MTILRDAIWANPDDDAPRVVYADSLGDDPRGELIVVQCALAAGDERVSIARRDVDLLHAHGDAWTASLGEFSRAIFERGFVETLEIGADALLAARPFEHEPITHLTLRQPRRWSEATAELIAVAQVPALARLHGLELPRGVGLDAWHAIVHSPYLAGLRSLSVPDADLEEPAFREVNALEALEHLRIDVDDTNLTNELGDSLAELALPKLRSLSLRAQLRSFIGESLLAFDAARIEHLDLHGHHNLPPAALGAVLGSVRSIGLGMCALDPMHVEVLANRGHGLVQLDLSDEPIEQWSDELAHADFPHLLDLDISVGVAPPGWRPSSHGDVTALIDASWFPRLETLRASGRDLRDANVAKIAHRGSSLRALTIAGVGLTDEGCGLLARATLPALELLDLRFNRFITHRGLALLAAAPWFAQLRSLRLPLWTPSRIDAPALRLLGVDVTGEIDTSGMPRLRELWTRDRRGDRVRARSRAPSAWPDRIFGRAGG